MPTVKVVDNTFADTKSNQQIAIDSWMNLSNKQQSFLNELAASWKGSSGTSYRGAVKELSSQTLQGLFMLQAIANQTHKAQLTFKEADHDASTMFKPLISR